MGKTWALADYRWVLSGDWHGMDGLSVDANRTPMGYQVALAGHERVVSGL